MDHLALQMKKIPAGKEEMGRPWVENTLGKSQDQQGVHCGWSSTSERESQRKWDQWGSQGPILCGFGFHSNCDGNPLEGSKCGSDIIFYCTENCFMNYFLLRKLLRGLAKSQWLSRNLTFLADTYTSGPVSVARNPGICFQICTFLIEGPWRGQSFWLNNSSSYSDIQERMKSEEERAGHLRECWNHKHEYGINKLVCRKSLGPFHNKKRDLPWNIIWRFND